MIQLRSVAARLARSLQRPWLAFRLTILFWRLTGSLRREERDRRAVGVSMVWGSGLLRQMAGLMLTHGSLEGVTRVRRYLAFLLLQGQAEQLTFRRDGTRWTSSVGEYLSWCLFNDGGYQQDVIQGLAHWIGARGYLAKENAVVIDVGANIGSSSIPLMQATGRNVISIEPVPGNFDLLQRNVTQNGLEHRIKSVNCAIAEQPGHVEMMTDPINCGAAEVREDGAGTVALPPRAINGLVTVPANPLVDVLRECGIVPEQVAVVWSDTQGCERYVIGSGAPLWSAGVPLFVEVWPPGLIRHGGVAAFLASANQYFESMVLDIDLVQRGAEAPRRPIAELPGLIESITGDNFRDVLLIPRQGR